MCKILKLYKFVNFGREVEKTMRKLKLRKRLLDVIESDRVITAPFTFTRVEIIPPEEMPAVN